MCDTPGLSALAGLLAGATGGGLGLHSGAGLLGTVVLAGALAVIGEGLIHARYGWPDGSPAPTAVALRRVSRAVDR